MGLRLDSLEVDRCVALAGRSEVPPGGYAAKFKNEPKTNPKLVAQVLESMAHFRAAEKRTQTKPNEPKRCDGLSMHSEPRPEGCEMLSGQESTYRLRHGLCRVIYQADDSSRAVGVIRVRHRKEVYRWGPAFRPQGGTEARFSHGRIARSRRLASH